MKKLMIAAVTLLALTVFAKPLSNSDLMKINNYLEEMIGENEYGVFIKFLSANINEEDNLLDASKVSIGFFGQSLDLAIALKGNLVNLNGEISVLASELGEFSEIKEMIRDIEGAVDQVNKKGIYKVSMLKMENDDGIRLSINVSTDKKDTSLKALSVKIYAPTDLTKNITASLEGIYFSDNVTVQTGRQALTNIVNDLIKGTEPAEADMEALAQIISDLLDEFQDELEE